MNDERIFVGREKELGKFTSMLERKVSQWVLVLAGQGGIGKTWLLRKLIALSQGLGAAHAGLLDFHYTNMQTEVGLLGEIGDRLGWEHFPNLAEGLRACETVSPSEREETLDIAVGHFVSGLRELAAECTVVLFFDTFERATETGVARWFVEDVLPQICDSAVVVLAGRNTFKLVGLDDEAMGMENYTPADIPLSPEDVHMHSLAEFSLDEVRQYLADYLTRRGEVDVALEVAPERYADLEPLPHEVQDVLYEKTRGHPVLVALAADWLTEWGAGAITDIKDLPPEQFKRAMVSKVRELETPEDQAVLRMAHVYHRFHARILEASYPELGELDLDPGQVIRNLSRFSFVKYWPEVGECLLHEEMQDLIEEHVWNEIDFTKEVRQDISANVVRYYDQAIDEETGERAQWTLQAERMYHRLYSDLEQGRPEFWKEADDAWTEYKLDLVAMLRARGEEVNVKLKDLFLDVMNRAMRAWVELEAWNLEQARELAQSVLEDPACTQRTRASALSVLGVYADRKGDGNLAIQHYQEALRLYRDLETRLDRGEALPDEHGIPRLSGVRVEISELLNRIGIAHRRKGMLDEAVDYYTQARAVARQEMDLEWLAASLNNIANIERLRGNLPLARSLCEQALRYRQSLQEEHPGIAYLHDIGLSHSTLGLVLRDMGEYDRAQEHFERAEEIFGQLHFRLGLVGTARNLGWVCYLRGKSTDDESGRRKWFKEALKHYQRSRQVSEMFHIELELPNLLNKIGIAQRALGDTEAAQQAFMESLKLARACGDNPFIANTLVRLAEMAYNANSQEHVMEYANELRQQFQERGFRFGLAYAEMEEVLAYLALDAGDYEQAFRHVGDNYAQLARLNRWRFDRKIKDLRGFFEVLPDDEWRRRCGEQLIRFWEEQGLAEKYADLTAICEEYIMGEV